MKKINVLIHATAEVPDEIDLHDLHTRVKRGGIEVFLHHRELGSFDVMLEKVEISE